MKRSSGVLLHITSLASRYGIGTLGAAAHRFVDFLHAAGQSYWQVLPLGPTGFGDSPYQPSSVFAGNPYLIDLDDLCAEGLLSENDISELDADNDTPRVDYGRLFAVRDSILRRAFERFDVLNAEFTEFCEKNAYWLDNWAVYDALKRENGMRPWTEWDADIRMRMPDAIKAAEARLGTEILFSRFKQFQFEKQWSRLREYAASRGVKIIGDIPIYASLDCSDVWSERGQFLIDEQGKPSAVAGVPPDAFSETGQKQTNLPPGILRPSE